MDKTEILRKFFIRCDCCQTEDGEFTCEALMLKGSREDMRIFWTPDMNEWDIKVGIGFDGISLEEVLDILPEEVACELLYHLDIFLEGFDDYNPKDFE